MKEENVCRRSESECPCLNRSEMRISVCPISANFFGTRTWNKGLFDSIVGHFQISFDWLGQYWDTLGWEMMEFRQSRWSHRKEERTIVADGNLGSALTAIRVNDPKWWMKSGHFYSLASIFNIGAMQGCNGCGDAFAFLPLEFPGEGQSWIDRSSITQWEFPMCKELLCSKTWSGSVFLKGNVARIEQTLSQLMHFAKLSPEAPW